MHTRVIGRPRSVTPIIVCCTAWLAALGLAEARAASAEAVVSEGFEQQIPNFHTYQAKYAADTARAHSGTHSLRVTPTGRSGGAYFRLDGVVDLKSDYEFSVWVYAGAPEAVRFYISASDGKQRQTKGQVSGGKAGQWVQVVGTLRSEEWRATDREVMLAMSCSAESWFDDVVLRKTKLPTPPIQAYPKLAQALRAIADRNAVRLSAGGELTLEATAGAMVDGFEALAPSRPSGAQVVIPPDGLLTFALDLPEPLYVTGTLRLAPGADLRPGLRAYALSDDTVVAAPMVKAAAWQGEGNPINGPAPNITGPRPPDEVRLATWLLPAGRHYLTVAGPHFRPAGTFQHLRLRVLPRTVEKPLYQFALFGDTHVGAGRSVWMNTMLYGPVQDELAATLAALKREGSSFAVIAGDMTNSGTRVQFEALGAVCRRGGLPVYGCIGNHDAFLATSRGDALSLCSELFPGGKTDYVVNRPPLRLIILDGSHWKSKDGKFMDHYDAENCGGIGLQPEQLQWLKQELARDTKTPTLVTWHFPMHHGSGPTSAGYELPPLTKGDEVLDALRQSPNVVAVLCGHTHWNDNNVKDGIAHIVNPALIEWPNAYRVFRVYPDRLEWELRQVSNRGFVRESFIPSKALAWMISTGDDDLTGTVSLSSRR
ncbi:MAG: metallophosphoesterase [Thermoguttaceae bacterium]